MKTETPQHTANLTRIVASLMIVEQQSEGFVPDPYNKDNVAGLIERAGQIYDEILESAPFFQFKPSCFYDPNGNELEVTV